MPAKGSRVPTIRGGLDRTSVNNTIRVGAWFSERLRRLSNKPDVVGSIPVTTEFFLISCDSNQVPKWFGTHDNLEVPL